MRFDRTKDERINNAYKTIVNLRPPGHEAKIAAKHLEAKAEMGFKCDCEICRKIKNEQGS